VLSGLQAIGDADDDHDAAGEAKHPAEAARSVVRSPATPVSLDSWDRRSSMGPDSGWATSRSLAYLRHERPPGSREEFGIDALGGMVDLIGFFNAPWPPSDTDVEPRTDG
jgi:hypothetical protein